MRPRLRLLLTAAAMGALCGGAHAQGLLGAAAGAGGGRPAAKTSTGPGYMGVTVETQQVGAVTRVRITSIDRGSPAQGVGLQVGDILYDATSMAPGVLFPKALPLTDVATFDAWLAANGPGSNHLLMVSRNGKRLQLTVALVDPSRRVASAPPVQYATAALPEPSKAPVAIAPSGPRVALVIGNSAYDAKLGRLANASRDAQLIATSLRSVGFEVEVATDLDQKGMKRAIARLGERISAKGPTATGLFFYAGHGLQSGGANCLAPIGAVIEKEADIDLESVAADTVLRQMEAAGNATNIVILDACRNTPVARATRSTSRGFARMDAPSGSFVAYSTAPGAEAVDGTGEHSPFAAALANELRRPGEAIEGVFRNVRRAVQESTGGRQTPWDSSSLTNAFYFAGTK